MAYDLDLRRLAIKLLSEGGTIASVSATLHVGKASIVRWKKRDAEKNLAASYPQRRGAYKIDEEALKKYVEENPDAYLHEPKASVAKSARPWVARSPACSRR